MKTRTWIRRAAASAAGLVAMLALGITPVHADTVIRKPQEPSPQGAMVPADGESGGKRPV
ncbi:hypothetical protein [Nonomuraea jabiensis]|uniref:Uncharacterized protein n=1 Tax=Nonomuraea jabiensis TaxID=882448 RepID=A0A7W9LF47_9ACTN|nr:hypothetical protein [Nonomuraea jabiensis]MBB5781527.1 hypothetical protein [Nonomuraea jabiensis]